MRMSSQLCGDGWVMSLEALWLSAVSCSQGRGSTSYLFNYTGPPCNSADTKQKEREQAGGAGGAVLMLEGGDTETYAHTHSCSNVNSHLTQTWRH